MAKYTPEQIGKAAELACFYVTPSGLWLRMDYVMLEEGRFGCHNEDNGEEYGIEFSEIVDDDVHFEQLVKIII